MVCVTVLWEIGGLGVTSGGFAGAQADNAKKDNGNKLRKFIILFPCLYLFFRIILWKFQVIL